MIDFGVVNLQYVGYTFVYSYLLHQAHSIIYLNCNNIKLYIQINANDIEYKKFIPVSSTNKEILVLFVRKPLPGL